MPEQSLTTQVTASAEVARAPTAASVIQPAPPVAWDKALLTLGAVAGALVAIATLIIIIHKALMKDVRRDVTDVQGKVDDLKHTVKGQVSRIDALEHLRAGDEARFARLETSAVNVEKTLDRIEHSQRTWFDKLEASIREIRVVAPRA